MKQTFTLFLRVFLMTSLSSTLLGCARESAEKPLSPQQQAYLLLDQGKYSQAILYLEKKSADGFSFDQRVELLASTYLAGAGIDLYSLYDIFQDDLLKKKSDESVLDRHKPPPLPSEAEVLTGKASQEDSVRKSIDWIDSHLSQLKHWSEFLSRFPKADSEIKHLYLERGLRLLFAVPEPQITRSLRLYRLLIQVVWFRQWLADHWLGQTPEAMGLKKICKTGLSGFVSEVSGVLPYLRRAETDAQILFPQSASTLGDVLFVFEILETVLRDIAWKELESRIRTELHCSEAVP